jgi:hypothetical protein
MRSISSFYRRNARCRPPRRRESPFPLAQVAQDRSPSKENFRSPVHPFMRIAFGKPVAAVPQLHYAAAILALGNGAFEIAIFKRVVLDRKALVGSGEVTARHGRGDAVELEAEIVVLGPRVMPLDDEAQRRGGRHCLLPGRFRCLGEIPIGAIFRYAGFRRNYLGHLFPRST